jgi:hypothetical protein
MCMKSCGLCSTKPTEATAAPAATAAAAEAPAVCEDSNFGGGGGSRRSGMFSCDMLSSQGCSLDMGQMSSQMPRGFTVANLCPMSCNTCGQPYKHSAFAPRTLCRDSHCNTENWIGYASKTQQQVNQLFLSACLAQRPSHLDQTGGDECSVLLSAAYSCVHTSPSTVIGPDRLAFPLKKKLALALKAV